MSPPPPVLSVHNLHKVYLERTILDDVTFTLQEGERVALLGANGAGKTTLLGILTGRIATDGGEVRMRRGLHVAALEQDGNLRDEWTVGEAIDSAFAEIRELEGALDEVHHALERGDGDLDRLLKRQGEIQHRLDERDPHTVESRAQRAMAALGVPPRGRRIGELSGGERRRTALCRTLLEDAELILLDEPTNHLDAETLDWLEDFLAHVRATVFFVTHDRYFLDNVATTMVELWRGRTRVYTGNYTDYLLAKEEEFERAERVEATRQNLLRREIDWMRRQPKARTTKSKSRMDRANELLENKPLAADPLVQLVFPSGPRLGNTLIEATKLTHAIGGRTLIRDFTMLLGAGDRIGIVGRNGLGKTTLLRLLLKQLEPDAGTVVHGPSVKIVYADQQRASLDPEKTVLEEVTGDLEYVAVGESRIGFRAWLKAFLFDEQTAAMPVRLLSGGERNRVLLAKMLREGGNIVVMDEPTNDLDLPSLRILEEALAGFPGCALIVSHDRYFLNRVATRILAFRGDGRIVAIEGNYDDYLKWSRDEAEREAARAQVAAPATPSPAKSAAAAGGSAEASRKKKLSFNEQQEFATIEQRIADAERRLAELQRRSEDPETYVKATHQEIQKLHDDTHAAQAEVERLMERWMELSERA